MIDDPVFERRVREMAASATSLKAPEGAWLQIAERLQSGDAVVLPTTSAPEVPARARALKVAVVLLFAAGAAMAALSSESLRTWVSDLVIADGEKVLPTALPPVREPAARGMSATTLLIEPELERIDVAFVKPAAGASIRLRFADVRELQVQASGAAAAAQFRSALGRLTITGAPASGELLLTIPTRIQHVEVRVNDRMYLLQQSGEVRIMAPTADTIGSEIVLPITSRP